MDKQIDTRKIVFVQIEIPWKLHQQTPFTKFYRVFNLGFLVTQLNGKTNILRLDWDQNQDYSSY